MSARGENESGYQCQKSVALSLLRRLIRLPQTSAAHYSIAAPDFYGGRWPSLNERVQWTCAAERWRRGSEGVVGKARRGRKDRQTHSLTPFPLILCLPFVMHPPHLQSCHWLVRTNHGTPCCLPAMYQFGQDDIKFLVLRVKDHMKTDVLITGSPVL